MARRIKLEIEPEWPYRLLGITSPLNDYRLVHYLSQVTGLTFQRMDDLIVNLAAHTFQLPLFTAKDKVLRVDYLLIPNRMEGLSLIPSEKRFDYFLIAGGEGKAPFDSISRKLQKNPHILFSHVVDITQWKEAPLFFHDLEMHSV